MSFAIITVICKVLTRQIILLFDIFLVQFIYINIEMLFGCLILAIKVMVVAEKMTNSSNDGYSRVRKRACYC